jgi:hypothetical protein
MKIDKKLDVPEGIVHFVGEVSEEELDQLITLGLTMLYLRKAFSTIETAPEGETLQ